MPNFYKHSLWMELRNAPNGLGDGRQIRSLKGDLFMEGTMSLDCSNDALLIKLGVGLFVTQLIFAFDLRLL